MDRINLNVSLFELVMSLSNLADLISPTVANHQKRVAYMAYRLAEAMGLDKEKQQRVLIAGALHDIGGLSLTDRLSALEFETEHTALHAQIGALLLRGFPLLTNFSDIILHHHTHWDTGGHLAPLEAQLIHLVDRVDVLVHYDENTCLLTQIDSVMSRIEAASGRMFNPQLVTLLKELSLQESFWLDLQAGMIDSALAGLADMSSLLLDGDDLLALTKMISHIIDFRSRFTATHSAGVAASAEAISLGLGYSEAHSQALHVAGYLHDLGKLAVPNGVLEKPGALSRAEFAVVRSHSYYTYRSLESISGLENIAAWAAYHHERLDGSGYPFRLPGSALCQEARIMAVADVFTAISEDRPYRRGMEWTAAKNILWKQVQGQALDVKIVTCLIDNYSAIREAMLAAQAEAANAYEEFWREINKKVSQI